MKFNEKTCPKCAETIKKAAIVCKHCGNQMPAEIKRVGTNQDQPDNFKAGCVIVVMSIVGLLAFCTPDNPTQDGNIGSETPEDESPFADRMTQSLWITKSKDGIRKRLKDADSAKFRDVRFYSGGTTPVVCGQVNAKNGLGGYSGFERFIASGDNENIAFLASDIKAGDSIDKVWDKLCISAPRDKAYEP
tara:strand:- start:135 stop:704 length:570 start_codon:yes stop_codon:yes gene_type:complete